MADKQTKIALILTALDKASATINKTFNNAEAKMKTIKKAGDNLSKIADPLIIAGAASTAFFGKTIADARESAIANARLEQVFKSMGETTGKAAKDAEDFASKLQFKIGFEDEEIVSVQAKLATFQSVISKQARDQQIYNRATQLTFDLQAAGFGEASQNAVQLGKALEDPVKGINALKRAGISFTEAEKKKIAALVAGNKKLEAQKIILAAVEKQVGGVAAATADPLQQMNLAYGEVSETIGKALLPSIQKIATKIGEFAPIISAFVEKHGRLIQVIAGAGAAFLVLGTIMKIVSVIMAANPIILIITAVAIAALLIYKYWKPIKQFFINLWDGIKNMFAKAWEFIKGIFLNYTPTGLVIKHWAKIKTFFANLWAGIKSMFSRVWEGIKSFFLNYTPTGLIIKHWKPITAFFSNLWTNIKNIFKNAWDWIMGLGTKFYDAGKNIISSVWNGIKSMITKPIDAIKEMTAKMREYLPFSPAKRGAFRDLHKVKIVETIAGTIKPAPVTKAMQKVSGQGIGVLNKPSSAFNKNNGGGMHVNLTVNISGTATQQDAQNIFSEFKKRADSWWRERQTQQQRVAF